MAESVTTAVIARALDVAVLEVLRWVPRAGLTAWGIAQVILDDPSTPSKSDRAKVQRALQRLRKRGQVEVQPGTVVWRLVQP